MSSVVVNLWYYELSFFACSVDFLCHNVKNLIEKLPNLAVQFDLLGWFTCDGRQIEENLEETSR